MNSSDNNSNDNRNDGERSEILQRVESFNRLVSVTTSIVQLYCEKYLLKQSCMNSKQSDDAWVPEMVAVNVVRLGENELLVSREGDLGESVLCVSLVALVRVGELEC
ncbi:hypothetical protein Goshw_015475 [Gossypium schwendimanii]|uniref:Uncharacterized protein n=1 Tax=Gossypium schwendimanii TaxID=34291 RepID=A0A7J9LNK8_GOSSC|nr:hypothetical protein [Gossypium schwendimanii]